MPSDYLPWYKAERDNQSRDIVYPVLNRNNLVIPDNTNHPSDDPCVFAYPEPLQGGNRIALGNDLRVGPVVGHPDQPMRG